MRSRAGFVVPICYKFDRRHRLIAGVVMAVAALLFAGALVALGLHHELGFWVLAGLAIGWQLVAVERALSRSRRRDTGSPPPPDA
nr:hypothetical protein GCM10020063_048780 [Dactylosporangium thailandense]